MAATDKTDKHYWEYIKILEMELQPATGCTEPIAIAYAAAKARSVLGVLPDFCSVDASGNIIKNAKSVVVPNTGGMRGIGAAASAGIVAGNADAQLQVISAVTQQQRAQIREYCDSHTIEVKPANTEKAFYISLLTKAGDSSVRVIIEDFHTNITRVEKDGMCIFELNDNETVSAVTTEDSPRYDMLSVERIIGFADTVAVEDIEAVLTRQIAYNRAIADEGIAGNWGAQIGKTLLATCGDDIKTRARAMAAAGSDARMTGCELPVVIVSGSGNQGMTASLPVIAYAEELHADKELLYRALVVSNLVTIHQKTSIGRLSAFCGAVSAGCGAAAGIAYLYGHRFDVIAHTIVNALAILSGMVCDGAKPSCAAKIAMAVEAGLLGFEMYVNGKNQFVDGEGLVKKGVDNTISTVGRMASLGMRGTDRELLAIMTENC